MGGWRKCFVNYGWIMKEVEGAGPFLANRQMNGLKVEWVIGVVLYSICVVKIFCS